MADRDYDAAKFRPYPTTFGPTKPRPTSGAASSPPDGTICGSSVTSMPTYGPSGPGAKLKKAGRDREMRLPETTGQDGSV